MTSRSLVIAGLALALLGSGFATFGEALAQTQQQPQAQTAPQAEEPPAKVFGDWAQRCTPKPPPGASPPRDGELQACFLVHQFVDPGSNRPVLKMTIGFFEPNRRPGAVVALPLGVPLARGIQISVDDQPVASVPFEVCRRDGCQAFVELNDDLIRKFKAGTVGKVGMTSTQGETLSLPFSLKGFTAGYDSIK